MSVLSEDMVEVRAQTLKSLMESMLNHINKTTDGIERAALCETLAKLISFSFDNDKYDEMNSIIKDISRRLTHGGSNGVDPLSEL